MVALAVVPGLEQLHKDKPPVQPAQEIRSGRRRPARRQDRSAQELDAAGGFNPSSGDAPRSYIYIDLVYIPR